MHIYCWIINTYLWVWHWQELGPCPRPRGLSLWAQRCRPSQPSCRTCWVFSWWLWASIFKNLVLIRLREERLIFSQIRLLISSNPFCLFVCFLLCFWNLEQSFSWSKFLVQQRETHRLKEQTYSCQEEGWGGMVGELGMDMYTLLYIKWITKKVLLYITGNSAVLCSIT